MSGLANFFLIGALLTAGTEIGLSRTTQETAILQGAIVDEETDRPLPARVYVRSVNESGEFYTVSPRGEGQAVPYRKERGTSTEVHTTVSEHGFQVELPIGKYEVVVERGKEYLTARQQIDVPATGTAVEIRLKRWANMAQAGWYSGDTHVHRSLDELPTAMVADDLNVALPLTYWVTDTRHTPVGNPRGNTEPPAPSLIRVDDTHVIWPVNTEYEIFTVDGKRHTLGAFFVLNHRRPLALSAPPVGPVIDTARREEGVLLELDKHNWPWSMMLIPVADIDLFELTNNHLWRTDFLFDDWYPEYARGVLETERNDQGGFTERGWLDFGFKNYYLLLNCGYHMRPTAGTASGVHPVPLGFGRVYVHIPGDFSYDAWMAGLDRGESFVTTGPLMDLRFNNEFPGARFTTARADLIPIRVQGWIESPDPIASIEVVINGEPRSLEIEPQRTATGTFRAELDTTVEINRTGWLAVRCYAQPAPDRWRFAHSGPVYADIPNRPLQPSNEEIDYLVGRIDEELERHQDVLPAAALEEYRRAKAAFEALRK